MQFDEKSSALETQLPNLRPRERIDADEVLKDDNSHVNNRQVQTDAIMILCDNHRHYITIHSHLWYANYNKNYCTVAYYKVTNIREDKIRR